MAKYVTGLNNVLRNITLEMMAVKGRTIKGMVAAFKHLEHEMDTTSPIVPERTKEMRNSWFIQPVPNPNNPIVIAGYTDPKAPIVHELEDINKARGGKPINWTKPGSGQKWVQIHFDRNRFEMMMIVAQHAKIPGTRTVGGLGNPGSFTNISNRTTERNVEF